MRPAPSAPQQPAPALDIICIGRSSVDLYGAQIGGRLEDMSGFHKYIGGNPANISVGCARLGLKSALITRVGDEAMGRFIRETLQREGVNVSHVITDPHRLTALVLLGIRDKRHFPLIFYRENCADMALCENDMDADFIASARALLVTGTHFSSTQTAAANFHAMQLARQAGRKVVFDLDYRPNLWNLGGHGDGESRFAASDRVTAHLQQVLPHCDLIVGTEEEWHITGGCTDTLAALRRARAIAPADAVLVCKRGPLGCAIFPAAADTWDDAIAAPVRAIEIFNVLGAGDAFMAGFLYGWLRNKSLANCALYANTCGALVVSRHGCAPACPSAAELQHMLDKGSEHIALRNDRALEQIHWATTRRRREALFAFAFDHRRQFLDLAAETGRDKTAIARFKTLALESIAELSADTADLGILVDDNLGRDALHAASDHAIWIGRPLEQSGIFPLAFEEGPDLGARLAQWPANHCVKVLAPLRFDDPQDIIRHHESELLRLADACRLTGHELLLEIITARADLPAAPQQILDWMQRLYDLHLHPDWWKLEPVADADFWHNAGDVIRACDPHANGILVLGKEMPEAELASVFQAAAGEPMLRGFAVGRTIFKDAARQWFSGNIDDATARAMMASSFQRLVKAWQHAKGGEGRGAKQGRAGQGG